MHLGEVKATYDEDHAEILVHRMIFQAQRVRRIVIGMLIPIVRQTRDRQDARPSTSGVLGREKSKVTPLA